MFGQNLRMVCVEGLRILPWVVWLVNLTSSDSRAVYRSIKKGLMNYDQLQSGFHRDYFISSFISGLEEELRPVVTMLQPQSIAQAYQLALLEEVSNVAMQKKMGTHCKSPADSVVHDASGQKKSDSSRPSKPLLPSASNPNKNSPTAKNHGACYKCGERYFYRHVCDRDRQQLTMMQAVDAVETPDPWPDDDDDIIEVDAQGKMGGFYASNGQRRCCQLSIGEGHSG
ncbi:unnamed protein product [Linum trigynum]|uniref:Uncharacterized protein n=1 Tax=Linum trigynum TaxID=586398 RepID=A0AAV2E4A6_9ROSI